MGWITLIKEQIHINSTFCPIIRCQTIAMWYEQGQHRVMTPSWDTCLALSLAAVSQGEKAQAWNLATPLNQSCIHKNTIQGNKLLKYLRDSQAKWGVFWTTQSSVSKCSTPLSDPGFKERLAAYGCWLSSSRNRFKNVLLIEEVKESQDSWYSAQRCDFWQITCAAPFPKHKEILFF